MTTDDATPIEPCPWCGEEGTVTFQTAYGVPWRKVMCKNCHACGPMMETDAEAVEVWNDASFVEAVRAAKAARAPVPKLQPLNDDPALQALLERSVAAYRAMPAEDRAALDAAQRKSWCEAEDKLSRLEQAELKVMQPFIIDPAPTGHRGNPFDMAGKMLVAPAWSDRDEIALRVFARLAAVPNADYDKCTKHAYLAADAFVDARREEAMADAPPHVVRHRTRGTTYVVVGEAELQAAEPIAEGARLTVYRCQTDGRLWARPAAEFTDGRFETLEGGTDG